MSLVDTLDRRCVQETFANIFGLQITLLCPIFNQDCKSHFCFLCWLFVAVVCQQLEEGGQQEKRKGRAPSPVSGSSQPHHSNGHSSWQWQQVLAEVVTRIAIRISLKVTPQGS